MDVTDPLVVSAEFDPLAGQPIARGRNANSGGRRAAGCVRGIRIEYKFHGTDGLGAEEVVGVKTYIIEIGQGLIEFMAIGTAVRKVDGMGVQTQNLPSQAIVRDRDTWVDGDSGFSLLREVQGS